MRIIQYTYDLNYNKYRYVINHINIHVLIRKLYRNLNKPSLNLSKLSKSYTRNLYDEYFK